MSARNRLLSQCVKSEPMQTRRGRRRIQGDDGVVLEKELLMQLPQLLDCRQAPPRGQLAGEDDSGSTRRLIGGTSFGNLDIPRWLRCRRIASSARQQRLYRQRADSRRGGGKLSCSSASDFSRAAKARL